MMYVDSPYIEMFWRDFTRSKPSKGTGKLIGCSVCGRSWVTLLKRDGKRICRECADNPGLVGGAGNE